MLSNNKFVLFMKGVPEMPMCGYSHFAVEILKFYSKLGVYAEVKDFLAIDILKDGELR